MWVIITSKWGFLSVKTWLLIIPCQTPCEEVIGPHKPTQKTASAGIGHSRDLLTSKGHPSTFQVPLYGFIMIYHDLSRSLSDFLSDAKAETWNESHALLGPLTLKYSHPKPYHATLGSFFWWLYFKTFPPKKKGSKRCDMDNNLNFELLIPRSNMR